MDNVKSFIKPSFRLRLPRTEEPGSDKCKAKHLYHCRDTNDKKAVWRKEHGRRPWVEL